MSCKVPSLTVWAGNLFLGRNANQNDPTVTIQETADRLRGPEELASGLLELGCFGLAAADESFDFVDGHADARAVYPLTVRRPLRGSLGVPRY